MTQCFTMRGCMTNVRALHTLKAGKQRLPGAVRGIGPIREDDANFQGDEATSSKETSRQPVRNTSSFSDASAVQKRGAQTAAAVSAKMKPSLPASSVTSWIADLVSRTGLKDLSDVTIHRSKRMCLDTLGVGFLGFQSDIAQTVAMTSLSLEESKPVNINGTGAVIWGSRNLKTCPATAAFINGVSVHSMDFDDTWDPATHPSGPTLPAVLALGETLTSSLQDVLVAYNVGIQVQALLLRSANSAKNIPWRFHPPAVVGVMGSAAACSNLLGLSPIKSRNALGIAASFAGAPMANAGTTTKPLHAGKAARFGLESALLAERGLEGNANILDMATGFGAFYDDFDPEALLRDHYGAEEFFLHHQDIALKRFPAHLAMHWTIDAALAVRNKVKDACGTFDLDNVKHVIINAPKSKYINRPLPASTDEARHSFQFNCCTALVDGEVNPSSYQHSQRRRKQVGTMLNKTVVDTPDDNKPSFQEMYVEIGVVLQDGREFLGRCDTPYGHWRKPLTDADVELKFATNTSSLSSTNQKNIAHLVREMSANDTASSLAKLMQMG